MRGSVSLWRLLRGRISVGWRDGGKRCGAWTLCWRFEGREVVHVLVIRGEKGVRGGRKALNFCTY